MLNRYFLSNETPLGSAIPFDYDPWLVALSYAIAVFASFTAFHLVTRVRTRDQGGPWLAAAGLIMGIGLWSMHFIAVLALIIPMNIGFDVALLALSAFFAVLGSTLAFVTAMGLRMRLLRLLLAGAILGIAVVTMHYIGMAALQMPAHIVYDTWRFGLSIIVAVAFSTVALAMLSRLSAAPEGHFWSLQIVTAATMGLAVTLTQYAGMSAAYFLPIPQAEPVAGDLDEQLMALVVATTATIVVGLALATALFGRRTGEILRSLAEAQAAGHVGSWEFDLLSQTLHWSDEVYRIYGVDPASFKPTRDAIYARIHPDDLPRLIAAHTGSAKKHTGFTVDHRIVMDDGQIRHVQERGRTIYDSADRPLRSVGLVRDVTAQTDAHAALQARLKRTEAQLYVTGHLSQVPALLSGDVAALARELTELAARATGCERVNVWRFDEAGTDLVCVDAFEATTRRHTSGMVLRESEYGSELHIIKTDKYVAADDPLTDPRTAGYVETYLKPFRITSMMDVLIHASGQNYGLLCFEHVGKPHHWEEDEIAFGRQLADKIGFAIMSAARREAEEKVRANEAALAEAEAIAHLGALRLDHRTGKMTFSEEAYRVYGWDAGVGARTYADVLARTHPDDRVGIDRHFKSIIESRHTTFSLDQRIVMDDGTVKFVHVRGRTTYDAAGKPIHSVGTVQDITERRRTAERLEFANAVLRGQAESSPEGILVVDDDNRIVFHNRRFVDMWRLPQEMVDAGNVGPVLAHVTAQVKDEKGFLDRIQTLHARPAEVAEDEIETKDGRFIDRYTTALTGEGKSLGRIWFFRDITEQRIAERKLLQMARYDVLTGLSNRGVFVDALKQAIERVRRGGRIFAVLYLDLDHFKDVNDTLGHPAGDAFLHAVGARLLGCVRAADLVARFGGDEFAVLVTELDDATGAGLAADKIVKELAKPYLVNGNQIRCGASMGVALYETGTSDPELLLSHADLALYKAKTEGRGTFRFFTETLDAEVRRRVAMAAELREALASDQFVLAYQPEVEVAERRIMGFEALVRWQHPRRGLLAPSEFIDAAEHGGLIAAVSGWVLRHACAQAKRWLDAGMTVPVAVNLSVLQFRSPAELERSIDAALAAAGLPPHRLEIELTETALMETSQEHQEVLDRLRERGIRLALDDFGTGYSSLAYLRNFPVSRIKIAQVFVADVTTNASSAAIVKAAVSLARELNLEVIAEGVESAEQLALLRAWGCHQAQGYYFSKPVSGEEATALLKRGVLRPAASRPAAGA